MPENAPIASPCKLICTLDLTSELCKGCGRTRGEIGLWTRYNDQQRADIMSQLEARLQALETEVAPET